MHAYMPVPERSRDPARAAFPAPCSPPSERRDMPTPDPITDPRRRRLLFRAHHRGTKEADLMIGGFVTRHVADFSEAEVAALEALLDLPDVDLADWLSGRVPVPADLASPLLARMVRECGESGAGIPPGTPAGVHRP